MKDLTTFKDFVQTLLIASYQSENSGWKHSKSHKTDQQYVNKTLFWHYDVYVYLS